MSCEVYSNGANLVVAMSMGQLPANFCPTTFQQIFNQIPLSLIGTIQGNFSAFVIGSDTPDTADRDKLWFKLDAVTCSPLGWFIYFGGAWVRAIPHPMMPGTIIDYYSAALSGTKTDAEIEAIVEALDGGDDGGGAFWYYCNGTHGTPDLRGRFRMGAGPASLGPRDAEGRLRTDRVQGDTGGEEVHRMDFSELPTQTFNYKDNVIELHAKRNDGTGTSANVGSGTETQFSFEANPFKTPAGAAHNTLPPYCAIYPIMRSSRTI